MMECDCKICKVLGIRNLQDIETGPIKGTLEQRVNKCAKIKKQQKQNYTEKNVEKKATDKGPRTETHYVVMGQNVTKLTASEIGDALIDRDVPQVRKITVNNAGQFETIFIPESYIPSTKFVSPEEKKDIFAVQDAGKLINYLKIGSARSDPHQVVSPHF